MPLDIHQAEFTHLAVQFVFENHANLQRFQDASDADYNENAIAESFLDFARVLWGDDAPISDADTSALLKNLAHFFAVLRRGSYARGGTTTTLGDLLVRLVGAERVERAEGTWIAHPVDPVETELANAHRDLHLTRVGVGRAQDFIDLAAALAFEYYTALINDNADLQSFGDVYDPRELAGNFLTSFRIALWEGIADDEIMYANRIASLDRFFLALWNRNYMRSDVGASREILVRLVGEDALEIPPGYLSETTPNERRDSTGDTNAAEGTDFAASNPILSPLFLRLDISESEDQPRDSYLRNAFQHAVAHIAFEVVNARRRDRLASFGAHIGQIAPNFITRITRRVRERYGARLWPQFASRSALPDYVIAALREYILALMRIPAGRAQNDQSALRVLDNILGLNQEGLQAGIAVVSDDGDEVDDGLECVLKGLDDAHESCLTSFATAADLANHLVVVHDTDPQSVRDDVQEAEIELKQRIARRR